MIIFYSAKLSELVLAQDQHVLQLSYIKHL
jgi:hypothetical protein